MMIPSISWILMVFLGFDGIDVGAAHPESIVTPFGMYCPPIRNPLSPHPESIVPPSGMYCHSNLRYLVLL